jgi:predicted secreted protein
MLISYPLKRRQKNAREKSYYKNKPSIEDDKNLETFKINCFSLEYTLTLILATNPTSLYSWPVFSFSAGGQV